MKGTNSMQDPISLSPLPPFSLSPLCPLCNETIDLNQPLRRISPEWSEALLHRNQWVAVAEAFRMLQSIEAAAEALRLTPELVERILQFLCLEICGCRRVTCPACLDDYRSAL
jgi:hypothetical protein